MAKGKRVVAIVVSVGLVMQVTARAQESRAKASAAPMELTALDYMDTYEKTPQGWRFKSRIHHAVYNPGAGRGSAPTRGAQPAAPGSQPVR